MPKRDRGTSTAVVSLVSAEQCKRTVLSCFVDLRAENAVGLAAGGGLIHLHGITLNVAEKSNEACTEVVHYSNTQTDGRALAKSSSNQARGERDWGRQKQEDRVRRKTRKTARNPLLIQSLTEKSPREQE